MNKGDSEIILYIIKSFEKLTDTLHNLCNQVGFLQKKKLYHFYMYLRVLQPCRFIGFRTRSVNCVVIAITSTLYILPFT